MEGGRERRKREKEGEERQKVKREGETGKKGGREELRKSLCTGKERKERLDKRTKRR